MMAISNRLYVLISVIVVVESMLLAVLGRAFSPLYLVVVALELTVATTTCAFHAHFDPKRGLVGFLITGAAVAVATGLMFGLPKGIMQGDSVKALALRCVIYTGTSLAELLVAVASAVLLRMVSAGCRWLYRRLSTGLSSSSLGSDR